MNRYEDQPAEILFRDLFDLGKKIAWTVDDQIDYDIDVAAIKHAVIREASVGVGTVRRAGEAPLPDAPQMFVPWETKDGDYDLIPKETVTVQVPEDTEAYTKMVKIMVYWKGRYEMAVRGMTDNAAIGIMGEEP